MLTHLLALLAQVAGDLHPLVFGSERVTVEDRRLHADQIDDATVLVLLPNRPLYRDGARAKPVANRIQVHLEVGAELVELVDEGNARNLVAIGLTPDRLGLRLD